MYRSANISLTDAGGISSHMLFSFFTVHLHENQGKKEASNLFCFFGGFFCYYIRLSNSLYKCFFSFKKKPHSKTNEAYSC